MNKPQKSQESRPERRKIPPESPHCTYRINSPTQPYDLDGMMREFGINIGKKIEQGKIVGFQGFSVDNIIN